MFVTVNCLLTASPSPQFHLTSLLQSIKSNSTPDQSDLTLSSGQSSVSLHTSLLCSLSPLLSSLLLSSNSLTTILLPSVSPCSLPLARELLYTGQCKGSLVQLEDAVLLLDLLGVQIQNEVVACCEVNGQIREGPFFMDCESTNNNNLNENVEDTFPAVQENSKIIGLPLDETYTHEQFVSIIVGPDDDFNALNLNDIQMESLPSFVNSLTSLNVQEVEEKNESCEDQEQFVSHTRDLKKKIRSYPCNECGYIATQKSNLKRHKEAKHGGIKTIQQYHGIEIVGVDKDIKMKDNPSSEAFHTLNVNGVEEELLSNCESSDTLIPGEKVEDKWENTAFVVGRDSKQKGIKHPTHLYSCNQCKYITSKKCNLKLHNQGMHKVLKILKQDHSNKGQDLNIEIDQRHESFDILNLNKNEKDFLFSFGNSDILLSDDEVPGLSESHVKQERDSLSTSETKDEMNYPCNRCNYLTTVKVSLKRHYQAKHYGVQNGKQGQSNKEEEHEDNKEELKIGVDNLKQQLFPCNQCEYVATQNGHLKRHVLAKHSLDRFNCNFCEKIFTVKESLRRHVKSIHENHTYPCPECNFVGKRPETLKYHVQLRHSEEKAICD